MTIKLRVSRRESKIPVLNHAGPKLLIDMLMISHSHLLKKKQKKVQYQNWPKMKQNINQSQAFEEISI